MKRILLYCIAALLPLSSLESASMRKLRCRITYYNPCKRWGCQVAAPNVKKATSGVTVAAHPDFKFGTRIEIPELKGIVDDGQFIVQDRGGAVTSKKASKGKAYVFDVFVPTRALVERYKNRLPEYMEVIVLN